MSIANPMGASVSTAASKIKGLLAEPSEPTQQDDPTTPPTGEPNNEERQQETQEATADSDTQAKSRRRTAKLGDREIEFEVLTEDVDLDLIPKGLMMDNDYRQKTMSHAENVKKFEAQKSDFDNKLSELQDLVMMEAENLESEEMMELKETDPNEYWQKFDDIKKKAERFKSYKESRDAELMQQQQQILDAEQTKYSQLIPEWLDESTKQKDTQAIVETLAKVGFNEAEIGTLYDARMISIARKAALYDQITSKSIESKRVQSPPKSSAPSSTTRQADRTASEKSMDRLRKTGKIGDASKAIKNLILGG